MLHSFLLVLTNSKIINSIYNVCWWLIWTPHDKTGVEGGGSCRSRVNKYWKGAEDAQLKCLKEIRKQNNYSQVNTNSLFDFCPQVQDKLCCIYIFGAICKLLWTEQDRWTLARMELFYGNKCILNYQRLHQPNHHHQAKAPRTMIASGEGRIMCSYSSVFANRRRIKRMSFCYRLFFKRNIGWSCLLIHPPAVKCCPLGSAVANRGNQNSISSAYWTIDHGNGICALINWSLSREQRVYYGHLGFIRYYGYGMKCKYVMHANMLYSLWYGFQLSKSFWMISNQYRLSHICIAEWLIDSEIIQVG